MGMTGVGWILGGEVCRRASSDASFEVIIEGGA